MTYPVVYDVTYSYTGFSASLGDGSFPGTQLDADLAGLTAAQQSLLEFIQGSFRSDGVLFVEALPQAADLTAYTQQALDAADAADVSAGAAATSAANAAASATNSAGSATAAAGSAGNAAASAAAAAASAAAPANNSVATATIQDLAVTTAKLASGALSADATGRGKMADGFLSADATGRAKMADGFVDYTKVADGAVVGRAFASSGALATTTTQIPNDDTIPQITEGAEFLTVAITPKSATNILRVEAQINLSPSASSNMIAAIFRDATANALGVGFALGSGGAEVRRVTVTVEVVAGSTSATTFRLRAGMGSAGTLTVNGASGARLFGGAALTSLAVTEFKAS